MAPRDHEWFDYYKAFDYFRPEMVRDGNQPRIWERSDAEGSVVLVHGLSDSPYYMSAIADHFHEALRYNVYLPLLQCHGLKDPKGMEGVELEEWKRNVLWSVTYAGDRTETVSVGGLSTGGALSFYTACTSPRVTGALYLFSAALDLRFSGNERVDNILEALLRSRALTWVFDAFDSKKPLIGDNPYKYAYVDKDGARELAKLIKEINTLLAGFDRTHPFAKRTFAAHSYADPTANIKGILRLREEMRPADLEEFLIDADKGVTHAGLVLKDDLVVNGKVLEPANQCFPDMMDAMDRFARAA